MPGIRTKSAQAALCMILLAALAGCKGGDPAAGGAASPSAAPSPEQPSPSPAAAEVVVRPDTEYQTIEGIGGNYAQANWMATASDTVGDAALQQLHPQYIRVPMPLNKWEPANDNEDAAVANQDGFKDEGVTASLFAMLRDMKAKGVTNITASIWEIPNWLVNNPDAKEKRIVPPDKYPELAESMAAFLLTAKNKYGVSIDYVSFNETNLGINVLFSPEEYGAFIKIAGGRFAKLGLPTKFLTGDTHDPASLAAYVKPLLENEAIRPYLGPLSFHSWWSDNLSDTAFQEIAELGKKYDLPVWCAEVGYDAMLWQKPEAFPTWDNALKLAKNMTRVIKYAGASVTHYWTYQDNYPLMSAAGEKYPAFTYMKTLADEMKAGTKIVEAVSQDPAILTYAAKRPDGKYMVQAVNTFAVKSVTFRGLPDGKIRLFQQSRDQPNGKETRAEVTNGAVTVTLLPLSISTLLWETGN